MKLRHGIATFQSQTTTQSPNPSRVILHLNPSACITEPSFTATRCPNPVISPCPASITAISCPPDCPPTPSSRPSPTVRPRTRHIRPSLFISSTLNLSTPSTSLRDPLMCDSHLWTSAARPPATYLAPFLCGEKTEGKPSRKVFSSVSGTLNRGGGWNNGWRAVTEGFSRGRSRELRTLDGESCASLSVFIIVGGELPSSSSTGLLGRISLYLSGPLGVSNSRLLLTSLSTGAAAILLPLSSPTSLTSLTMVS